MLSQYRGDLKYAYPGFETAAADSGSALWATRPALDQALERPLIGNDQYHILSAARSGDNLDVVICNYSYRAGRETADGSYESLGQTGSPASRGIYALEVQLQGSPTTPTQRQEGPRADPEDDVFGDWVVRGLLNFWKSEEPGFAEAWPTYEADRQTCVDRAPDPAPERARIIDGTFPHSEFPTQPASPGWPEGRSG